MENIWSTDSIIDERRIGSISTFSIFFFLFLCIMGTIFFMGYPLEDHYVGMGEGYREGEHFYIKCYFPVSKFSYLDEKYFYVQGKRYRYKVIDIQLLSKTEGEVYLQYNGKKIERVARVEWRKGKQTLMQRLWQSFRKERA